MEGKKNEKEEKSSRLWSKLKPEEIDILENKLDLKTEQDCFDTNEELCINSMTNMKFDHVTIHFVIKKIKTIKREFESKNILKNKIPKSFSAFDGKNDLVEYVTRLISFIKRNNIENWKQFILEKFKNLQKEKFDDLKKFLQETNDSVEEAEHKIVGTIDAHYGKGIDSFYQLLFLQQQSSSLKLFAKKLKICCKGIGNEIPESYKIAVIENKFDIGILSKMPEYEDFHKFGSVELIERITNFLKKKNSKNIKKPKCFKCQRFGHISSACTFETTVNGEKLIPNFKMGKREENYIKEDSQSPKRRRFENSDDEN